MVSSPSSAAGDDSKNNITKQPKIKPSLGTLASLTLLFSAFAVAILAYLYSISTSTSSVISTKAQASITITPIEKSTSTMAASVPAKRLPIYFVSHGGPNIMYEKEHPVYSRLQNLGKEITQKVRPKAVVVLSAHWQAGEGDSSLPTGLAREHIQVNTEPKEQPLIYDFFNFPSHYYKEKYPHVGSSSISSRVLSLLSASKIPATGTKRGLDHGVWAVFRCLFDPDTNPLSVPLIQVSLFPSESPISHLALGKALAPLRDEGVLIIGSGMAVHNLRDLWTYMSKPGSLAPYTKVFDKALTEAVVDVEGEERERRLEELLKRKEARQAHPTFEHLLPVHICAGAAGEDRAEKLFDMPQGSMAWSMFRFGEVVAAQ